MEYKQVNDYELMYMIRESDDNSFDIMFKKYSPVIKKIALKYYDFAKKRGAELEDLIQEGMIALNRGIISYNESSGVLFYTYACLCVERHIITYCRNIDSYRHAALNYSTTDDILFSVKDENSLDYEKLIEESASDRFVYYKNLLDFKCSNVFELRYNGFSYKEISKLLDVPVSTVDGRLCKVRRILRENDKKMS